MRVAVVIATFLAAAAVAVALESVAFRTVAGGDGSASSVTTRSELVIRDRATWRRLWRRIEAGVSPRPSAPRVDFSRYMLIAVTQGRKSSGGYSIRVRRIVDDGRRLRVAITERLPGDGCITPAVITSPYHVVRIRRTAKRATFRRQVRTYAC